MSVVVEFCGLPGAGKSTLCRDVASRLRAEGIEVVELGLPPGRGARVRRLGAKGAGLAAAAVLAPNALTSVARAAWSSGLRGREWLARTVNIVVLDRRVRRRTGDVVLVDQGVVQEVVAAGLSAHGPALASRLPEACGSGADVVVRVDVPASLASRRLGQRGTGESRLEHLAVAARMDALQRAAETLDAVLAPRTERLTWRVDGAAPDAGAALADAIMMRIPRSAHR